MRLALVTASHGSRHTCIKAGGKDIAVVVTGTGSHIAERKAEEVGTMFQSKLNAFDEVGGIALSIFAQNLDGHNLGTWGNARLSACRSLSRQNASSMGAMSMVVHGVVVMVENIIAVMRKFTAAIPHAVGNVDMIIVDTRIDETNYDAVARIACAIVVPNCRRVDHVNMPSIGFCGGGGDFLVLRNHLAHLIGDNHGNILAFSQLCDDFFAGQATEAVE